jgi:O-antigen/teichoic acid export membrane protein
MFGLVERKPPATFGARLISGSLWAIVGKSLSACGSFVVFLMVANSIGSNDTSVFIFCESAAIVGALLATGGLHSVIVRILRNWQHDFPRRRILSFGRRIAAIYLGMFFVFACAAFLAITILKSTAVDQLSQHFAVVICWTLLLGANQLVSEFLRGFENFRDAATMGGQNPGVLTLGVLLPIFLACSLTETMTIGMVLRSQVFALAVTLVFGLLRLRKTFRTHASVDASTASSSGIELGLRTIFAEGMPNLFTQITTLGVTQGEILILGQMASGQEIAAYAGIKRLVQLTGAPLLMINSALPTFIADLVYQKNMGRLESILRGSTTLCCLPLLLASTIFIAFPMWTINLFFDADYSVGVRCLQILSVGNIAAVASGSCGLLLMMSGNQRYAMMSGTIGAIVFVILAPRLTSVFGITGMALGVAVSTIIRSIMSATFAKQRVGIWSVPTFSRTMMRNAIKLVRSEKA